MTIEFFMGRNGPSGIFYQRVSRDKPAAPGSLVVGLDTSDPHGREAAFKLTGFEPGTIYPRPVPKFERKPKPC